MKCDRVLETFSGYLEGTIEPPLALAVRSHLKECADCRDAYEAFQITWNALESAPMVEMPLGLHERIMAGVREAVPERKSFFGLDYANLFNFRVPVRAFAVAATAVIIAVMFAFTLPQGPPKDAQQPTIAGVLPWDAPVTMVKVRPGLRITVEREHPSHETTVYRVILKPAEGVQIIQPAVYVIPKWDGRPDQLEIGVPIFHRGIKQDDSAVVPVVIEHSQFSQEAITLYISWTHKGEPFSSLVFLPTQKFGQPLDESSVGRGTVGVFQAMKIISARYAAVIIASGDMNEKVTAWPMSGPIEDAFNSIAASVPMTWSKKGYKSYSVEIN